MFDGEKPCQSTIVSRMVARGTRESGAGNAKARLGKRRASHSGKAGEEKSF
jgi:hypothetical protein